MLRFSSRGIYKIGSSSNPSRRLGEIQNMSPVILDLVWKHPGDIELETHLHHVFTENRSHGEWFIFEDDPLPQIKQAVEDYLGYLEEEKDLDTDEIWEL